MKQLITFLFIIILVLGFSIETQADLFNRGTDSLGNRLIYDSDLNITWYDYTARMEDAGGNGPVLMANWASTLTVDFEEIIYDDWRLTTVIDGPEVWGYDGSTTGGWNITSSEMGHLFYIELGNNGEYDTSGNLTGCGFNCLTNTGPFQNLGNMGSYWTGTLAAYPEYPQAGAVWKFQTGNGLQLVGCSTCVGYGFAVRSGDVAVVPEPISSILFLTGGVTLMGRKYIRRKKIEV